MPSESNGYQEYYPSRVAELGIPGNHAQYFPETRPRPMASRPVL